MKRKIFDKFSLDQAKRERSRRIRVKRTEEYDYLEGVFDKPTLLTIYKLLNDRIISEFNGAISTGKESKVYHAVAPNGQEFAVKIFNTGNLEFRKSISRYIIGDPRFVKIKKNRSGLMETWAFKEYTNLKALAGAGLYVPKPVTVRRNVLVMHFLGDNGIRAPLLREVSLDDPEKIYDELANFIRKAYSKSEIVHGDLSEYNVIVMEGRPYVIDVSQAVSIKHPLALEFLDRDIQRINSYFRKLGVKVLSEEQIKAELR